MEPLSSTTASDAAPFLATKGTTDEAMASPAAAAEADTPVLTHLDFRMRVTNLPRYFGVRDFKKAAERLGVHFHRFKMSNNGAVFATFQTSEERDQAIEKMNGVTFKKSVLFAEAVSAAPDPYQRNKDSWEKKRQRSDKSESTAEGQDAKRVRTESDAPYEEQVCDTTAPLWRVPYEDQLEQKMERFRTALKQLPNALRKDGKAPSWLTRDKLPCEVLPIIPSPDKNGYRNKCEFNVGFSRDGEEKTVGFRFGSYATGTTAIAPPTLCVHVPAVAIQTARLFQSFIRSRPSPAYDIRDHKGFWRMLTVRSTTLGLMVVVQINSDSVATETFSPDTEVDLLKQYFLSKSQLDVSDPDYLPTTTLLVQRNNGLTIMQQGPIETLFGEGFIYEQLFGLKFRISVSSFFQVNTGAAERLYSLVREWCSLPSAPTATQAVETTDAVTETEKVISTESVTESVTETAPVTESVTESVTETAPVTESVTATESVTESVTETAPVTATESATAPDTATESSSVNEGSADAGAQAGSSSVTDTETSAMEVTDASATKGAAGETNETIIADVCCGTGTIGITMASSALRVIGLEIVEEAVRDAKINAQLNDVSNIEFLVGKAEETLPNYIRQFQSSGSTKSITAVLDPPRAGVHFRVINTLRKCASVRRVVFVACNIEASINNVRDLCKLKSKSLSGDPFRLVKAQPVDLFPHTKHAELVLLFERF